jgi:hypothetical protein
VGEQFEGHQQGGGRTAHQFTQNSSEMMDLPRIIQAKGAVVGRTNFESIHVRSPSDISLIKIYLVIDISYK